MKRCVWYVSFDVDVLYFSRVFKSPQEIEILRYTNRISSEAHTEVI